MVGLENRRRYENAQLYVPGSPDLRFGLPCHEQFVPQSDPDQLELDWARERFGRKSAPQGLYILGKIAEAARGMLEFDTQFTSNHRRFPKLECLDLYLCGSYGYARRMSGLMCMPWPLDMYPPQKAAEIKADPRCRLLFNQVMITPELKTQAMAQKRSSVNLMEEIIILWQSLEEKIDAVLEGTEPLHGAIVPEPMAENAETLIGVTPIP